MGIDFSPREWVMKFKCPKCSVSFKSGDSRYNIWKCDDCGHKFRGIHCEADMLDYWLHMIPFLPGFYTWDRSYDLQPNKGGPNFTRCPHCLELVRGFLGKTDDGVWPTTCPHCTKNLPINRYEPDTPKEPEEPKVDPKPKAEVKPQPDYKKLRELINRL